MSRGRRTKLSEDIIKKLARVAGLAYADKHPLGGGLCQKIIEVPRRRRALIVLTELVSGVGEGSADRSVERAGASWLDVLGWREDAEYAKLWNAAMRVRREIAGSLLEDQMWDRALNGYEVEEARSTRDGIQRVMVRKFDNGLALQLLRGMGFVGKTAAQKRTDRIARVESVDADNAVGNVDTVLFADRATAFNTMPEVNVPKRDGDDGDDGDDYDYED